MKLQQRLYRSLLRAYPRPFREEYSDLMVQLFADQVRDAHSGRGPGLAILWLRSGVDVVANATAHRLGKERPVTISYYPTMMVMLGLTVLALMFAGPSVAIPLFAAEVIGFTLYQRRTGLVIRPAIQHPTRAVLIGIVMIAVPTALLTSPLLSDSTWGETMTLSYGLAWLAWAVVSIAGLGFIAAGLVQAASNIFDRRSGRPAA